MTVNGESIFGTRPWVKFGEGPVADTDIKLNAQGFNEGMYDKLSASDIRFNQAQGFNEGMYDKLSASDIRFNQTKKHLYATALGWPEDGKLVIKSLAKGNKNLKKGISSVYLLGYGKVKARQTAEGLEINLPSPCNKIAPVLRINK